MYQEWESPSFGTEQLLAFCRGFFEARNYPTTTQTKGGGKSIVKARITSVGENQTVVVEMKGRKLRLTYLPLSHAQDGLARLGGLLVTGRMLKSEAQKQQILDRIEQQFWEELGRKIPQA